MHCTSITDRYLLQLIKGTKLGDSGSCAQVEERRYLGLKRLNTWKGIPLKEREERTTSG